MNPSFAKVLPGQLDLLMLTAHVQTRACMLKVFEKPKAIARQLGCLGHLICKSFRREIEAVAEYNDIRETSCGPVPGPPIEEAV